MGLFGNWPSPAAGARSGRAQKSEHRILFVCTGNIARSASADLIARQRYGALGLEYSSAGIGALVGHGVAADVAPALHSRAIVVDEHRARQFTGAIGHEQGLILALDRSHRRWILDEWPELVGRVVLLKEAAEIAARALASEGGVDASVSTPSRPATGEASGRRSIEGMPVAEWIARQASHDAAFDLIDPFRRGAEAGERAVAEVEQALEVLLPWYAHAVRHEG